MPDSSNGDAPAPAVDARDAARDLIADMAIDNGLRDASADARDASSGSNDSGRDATGVADAGSHADASGDAVLLPITIWIAGDSTVQTYPASNTSGVGGREHEGWGQELAPFFNDKVSTSNRAIHQDAVARRGGDPRQRRWTRRVPQVAARGPKRTVVR